MVIVSALRRLQRHRHGQNVIPRPSDVRAKSRAIPSVVDLALDLADRVRASLMLRSAWWLAGRSADCQPLSSPPPQPRRACGLRPLHMMRLSLQTAASMRVDVSGEVHRAQYGDDRVASPRRHHRGAAASLDGALIDEKPRRRSSPVITACLLRQTRLPNRHACAAPFPFWQRVPRKNLRKRTPRFF